MKLSGKIFSIVFSLLIITSISLWIMAKNVDPETIKQLVNNKITSLTHKKSHIDGAISWQLFPRPGLKFNKIAIGDDKISDDYSLTIDSLLLKLKITPLLRGQFVFSEVNIDGLKMEISLDAPHEVKPHEESTDKKTNDASKKEQFAIEKLLVSHAQLIISKNSRTTTFKNIQIGVEQFNLKNMPFTVQVKAKLNEYLSNPQIKANLNFKGRLSLPSTLINQFPTGINQASIDGQILLQNVTLNQFVLKKIRATLKTNKSGFQFNPLTLSLYNGESIGHMDYAFDTQQFSLSQTATNLNGKQLMTQLLGNELISGNLDYSIHATIPLKDTSIETITGNGSITIKDGEIYKLNMKKLLANIDDKLKSLTNDNQSENDKFSLFKDWDSSQYTQGNTSFKLASIQYQFQKGTLSSDSILLQTDNIQANGKGHVNLANLEINSSLQVSINNNNTDLNLQKMQNMLGGFFPLALSGTLAHPEVRPDIKAINVVIGELLMKMHKTIPLKEIKNKLKELVN